MWVAIERANGQVVGGHGARVTVLPNCLPGSRGQSTIMTVINITIRKQDSAGGLGETDGDGERLRNGKRKCNFNLCEQFNRWRWLHLFPLQINFQEQKNVSQTSLAISKWQLTKKVKQHFSHADLHWQHVKMCAIFINELRLLVVTKGIKMRRCQVRKKARCHDPPGFAPALLKIDLALEC